jgi:hypothetical protein
MEAPMEMQEMDIAIPENSRMAFFLKINPFPAKNAQISL